MINEDLSGPLAESLSRHLPQYAHNYIFGKGNAASEETAAAASKKRTTSKISVYLVSTNQDQIGLISQMWSSIPCRVVLMKGNDFFDKSVGRYETMGVDRLAVLRGAADLHGFPALVIDGGTATTYTAADAKGRIMGGGIGAGLQIKLRCMHEYTDSLPLVGPQDALARVKEALDRKKTLPLFSRDTTDAMLASVLGEYASFGRTIIQTWLSKVGHAKNPSKNSTQLENHGRTVMITGGDGEVLTQLLRPNLSGILECAEKKETPLNIVHSKQLIHYGIAAAIMQQVKVVSGKTSTKSPYLKSRVAKTFDQADHEGDHIFRGTVTLFTSHPNGDVYTVRYDDGDREQVDLPELKSMLQLFNEVGEKSKKTTKAAPQSTPVTKKRNNSTDKTNTPAAKRTKRKKTVSLENRDPNSLVKKRIAKDFDGTIFYGEIEKYTYDEDDGDLWHIVYDDGDSEDLDRGEVTEAFELYTKTKQKDKKRTPDTELVSEDEAEETTSKNGDKGKDAVIVKKDTPE